jgi:MFS family permease
LPGLVEVALVALQTSPTGAKGYGRARWFRRWLPRYRRNLWLLLAACLVAFLAVGVQGLILNLYLLSLGFREDFLGLFSFANTAGIGGAALIAAPMANRFGSRRSLIGAAMLFAASSAALALTGNPVLLLGVAVANGVALAHIFVPSATYVMDNAEPTKRATAYAGYFTAQSFGAVLGSYLGGILPTAIFGTTEVTQDGYRWTLIVAAAIAGLAILPLKLADDQRAVGSLVTQLPTSSRHAERHQERRDILWIVGSTALMATSMGFVIPFLNVFFSKQLGATTDDIGIIFAVGACAMVVASIVGPTLGRRFGVVPLLVGCRLVTAPIMVAMGFSPTILAGAGLYVLRILFTNMTWPVDNAFTMELVRPSRRATLAGIRSASWNLAWALSSGLGGLMIVQLGFPSIFAVGGLFMVGGGIIYFVAFRSRERQLISRSQPEPRFTAD